MEVQHLKIERTYDQNECDQEGCSGGYAEGANVYLNDKLIYQFVPKSHCFGGDTMTTEMLFKGVIEGVLKEFTKENILFTVEEIY